jgi:hypothetical protein
MESFLKVTIESITGISIGIFDRCLGDQVPEEPVVASHFLSESWEKFCNNFQISSKGVTFSDAKPSEFDFARIIFRDRNGVNCENGTSSAVFTEILIEGQLDFVIRFPENDKNVEFFVYHLNDGEIKIGGSIPSIRVLDINAITKDEAETFETTQPAPEFEPEKCGFDPHKFGLTVEDVPELRNILMRSLASCFCTKDVKLMISRYNYSGPRQFGKIIKYTVLDKKGSENIDLRDFLCLYIDHPCPWKSLKPRYFFPWIIKKVEEMHSP